MAQDQDKANDQGTRTLETPRAEPSRSFPGPTTQPYGPDDVARRAYQRFLERGGAHGHDVEDWFEAERELLSQDAGETATPPHGDELAAPPRQPVAPRTAEPRGRAARAKKGTTLRPDRAADQQ